MAYDGIFIKEQINEILVILQNEHISKVTETSHRDVNFHFRKNNKNYIFTLDANPNFPHMLIHDENIDNMKVPTAFCMLLRKYIQGGVIKDIYQIGNTPDSIYKNNGSYERIVKIIFENVIENGDFNTYFIFFEIMGKYSNIIITDSNYIIIDTLIKSIVENNRLKVKNKYSITEIAKKIEITTENTTHFESIINSEKVLTSINNETFDISSAICKNYAGISKQFVTSELIEFINNSKQNEISDNLNDNNSHFFNYSIFDRYITSVSNYGCLLNQIQKNLKRELSPSINYKDSTPSDFYLYKLNQYEGNIKYFKNLNLTLSTFINEKYSYTKDSNEKKLLLETVKKIYQKLNKKKDIYEKELAECKDLEKYKNFAELISAFAYDKNNIKGNKLICNDYNNNNITVEIPIDTNVSIAKNVEKYYSKYNKQKRTILNADKLLSEIQSKFDHLDIIKSTIDFTNDKNDLYLIKKEICDYFDESKGLISLNEKTNEKSKNKQSKKSNLNYNIHHYKSSSGIDIMLGKNNLQNEYLTFSLASPNDTWLHIKNATGSHVIIKKPYELLDDKTLIEAASLAAYFSDRKNETKATVDYTLRKELKKVKGKGPGFCIYHKNYIINFKPEMLIKEI